MARYTENQIFRIAPESFDEIDDWIRAAQQSGRNIRFGMDALTMLLARTNQAFAMEMSRGPLDPSGRRLSRMFAVDSAGQATPMFRTAAWRIPVRRITSRYYKGWKVKRLAPGAWMLYNESREAYYIEFGINWLGGNRRISRPVQKLSLIKTLRFVDQSRARERIWEMMFAPYRFKQHRPMRGELIEGDIRAAPTGRLTGL